MVDTCVAPSELHLKKELTALRKARFLRDPETCSSWRSALSSNSFAAAFSLNHGNGTSGNSKENNNDKLLQLSSSRNRLKRVYLYNWKNHSSKSSESGIKLDEDDRHISVEGSVEDNSNNLHKTNSTMNTCLEDPLNSYNVSTNSEAPLRRTVKKSRKTITKKQPIKDLPVSRLLDLQSSSIGVRDSVDQSDDTEYCNSEDMQQLTQGMTQKTSYCSPSASPIFSGSGCGKFSYTSKIFRSTKREGSSHSYTPASTSSYYRHGRNSSIVESWDGTVTSMDGDELDQLDLQRHQGCGIPCDWSKRTKDRVCGGFYSPSLSDTLRRKGSSLFCGSQTVHRKKRSAGSHKKKYISKTSQGLLLLTDSCDGGNSLLDSASGELSTDFGELELEALNRLDGMRWSSCKSQEGLESLQLAEADIYRPDDRNLSQKYMPRTFDELIGQNIVIQSLTSAIRRGRIAPAYLFQGPRGTGKTTTARVFAAALNCLSAEEKKPCLSCSECNFFFTGKGSNVREVNATNKKGLERARCLLKNMSVTTEVSGYKVFIIDECHMLSSRVWSTFINFLEEPPSHLVFIFITTDPENLPRAIVSRCQKYHFSKVKDVDIVCQLRKISYEENLDIDLEALDSIALNSDGSLQDAVTMLDQLNLLGKRITTSLVNELVGVVSDERLLDLLEIAMSSDTAETVKRSRELMDSGVDPVALMSQLAGLIMDIIAGSNQLVGSQSYAAVLGGRSLSEDELKRLQQALNIISDAEKQLRLSSERSTWFTAALLQLGSGQNAEFTLSSSSSKHSSRKTSAGALDMPKDTTIALRQLRSTLISRASSGCSSPNSCLPSYRMAKSEKLSADILPANSQSAYMNSLDTNHEDDASSKKVVQCVSPAKLAMIWRRCIQRCHSETLRERLSSHGKLVSITEIEGALVAFIVFEDGNIKSIADRYLSSITNSIETVLQHTVEVRIGLVSENIMKRPKSVPETLAANHASNNGHLSMGKQIESDNVKISEKGRFKGLLNFPRGMDCSEATEQRTPEKSDSSLIQNQGPQGAIFPMVPSDEIDESIDRKEKVQEALVLRTNTAAMDEHLLESAWLQAAGKNSSGSTTHSISRRNLGLRQNGISCENHIASVELASSKHWEDDLHHITKALKSYDVRGPHKEGPVDQYAISPSLLHSSGLPANVDKENLGYESGHQHGCTGLLCWQPRKSRKGKVKQGIHVRSPKSGSLHCLGGMRSRRHEKAV